MGDLRSRGWIVAKGLMFAVLVGMTGVGVILHEDRWFRVGFLLVCLWAACRFYYFLFHVLERYVGVEGRYAGILDLCRRLWRRRKAWSPGSAAAGPPSRERRQGAQGPTSPESPEGADDCDLY